MGFAIANPGDAKLFCESTRTCRVRFALDDLGSDVSSFACLRSLPVEYLKIDGKLIRALKDHRVDRATVRCVPESGEHKGQEDRCGMCRDSGRRKAVVRNRYRLAQIAGQPGACAYLLAC
ncbi:EAL domain-containing protein [Paraburkholderia fynbosensis]|uniref:EAL domain-containing protein n=1 Tax=Paraburkholderia fynbosensis TaxID=1200993 RepID=UPI0015827844